MNNNINEPARKPLIPVDIYVDGTYSNKLKEGGWAFIVLRDGNTIYEENGTITDERVLEGWQIGGECAAVLHALQYCKQNNYKAKIFHDYTGLKFWVADIFGEKPWKAKKWYTKAYREYVVNNQDHVEEFVKVKAHADDYFNNKVDELTRKKS